MPVVGVGAFRPQTDIIFEANYEGANCEQVYWVKDSVYEVWLRCDSNTFDTTWFDFKMKTQKYVPKVKLRICNLSREQCPMSFGVRPAFRSKQLESQTGVAWYFSGNSLSFKQVDERRIQDINLYNLHVRRTYFQFEFDFHFPKPDPNAGFQGDEVRCAMQVPYTYSKLLSHLNELMLL